MPKLIIGGKDAADYSDEELMQMLATLQGKRVEDVQVKARERKPRTAKEIRKYAGPAVEL